MKKQTLKWLLYALALFVFDNVIAQDKIYKSDGTIFEGKVVKVGPSQIQVTVPDGPEYTMNQRDLDSIVYASGRREKMGGLVNKVNIHENIPQLNTWTFDVFGFTFLSINQSYERRLKSGKVGFRVPLYIGFIGGGLAGLGTFEPGTGVYYPFSSTYSGYTKGFSIATGFNPKFYFFKHRRVRPFAGPELDLGYSRISNYDYGYYNNNGYYNPPVATKTYFCGTAALLASFGITFNPKDKVQISVHGAAGGGNIFGSNNPVGWTGVWQIGLSIGPNF